MSRWLLGLLALALAACRPAPAVTPAQTPRPSSSATPPPGATPTLTAAPTRTSVPPSLTPSPTVSPPPTSFGWLARPIPSQDNPFPDRGYPYGSTANGTREPHHGVEFINPYGTPVLAAADGRVLFAGDDQDEARFSPWTNFYGNLVVLAHHFYGQTFYTLYAHLSEIEVQTGQHVHAGDRIGAVGMTGAAIGSHLHFEVRLDGTDYTDTRNPVLWLQPADPTRRGALAGRIQRTDGTPVHTTLTIQQWEGETLLRQYPVETYAPEKYPVPTNEENFALGDLPPGDYRLALVANGQVFERWITVENDTITRTEIIIP